MKVSLPRLCPDPLSSWLWHVPVLRWHHRQNTDLCLVFFFPNFFILFLFSPQWMLWAAGREAGKG